MIKKLEKTFMYIKIGPNDLTRINPKITKANLTMLTILSTFATFLIAIVLVASFFFEGIRKNQNVYIAGLILSLLISIICLTVAKTHNNIIRPLVYLSYTIYYMYGIIIGTITDPHGKTVTFMVLLAFLPSLFIDKPIRIISINCLFVGIFIMLSVNSKTGTLLSVDILDAIVFTILGCSSGFVINNVKIRGYILEQQLQEISRIDQLTQMRNRNAFELERSSVREICKHTLAVIFIDVNGLHEINNEKGHDYGDEMLKFIADEVKKTFSNELTYRIGGDEFVGFVPDKNEEEIESLINSLIEVVEKNNYHIAIGYEISGMKRLSVSNLIAQAEKNMLNNKRDFYKNIVTRKSRNTWYLYVNQIKKGGFLLSSLFLFLKFK